MTRFLGILILLIIIYSCSRETKNIQTYFGVSILTDGPSGAFYIDSSGKGFAYRSFAINIFNDTIIPIQLQLEFSKDSVPLLPKSDKNLRVFLLPDTLTRAKQYISNTSHISPSLNTFLNNNLNAPSNLKITINPKNTYNLNIGALYCPADAGCHAGLFVNGDKHDLPIPIRSLDLNNAQKKELILVFGFQINPPNNYTLIKCGKLVFIKD